MLELQEGEVGLRSAIPSRRRIQQRGSFLVRDYNFNSYNSGNQTWEEKGYAWLYRDDLGLIGEILPKLHSSTINGYRCVRVDYVVNENLTANGAMDLWRQRSNQGPMVTLRLTTCRRTWEELAEIDSEGIEYGQTHSIPRVVAVATESLSEDLAVQEE